MEATMFTGWIYDHLKPHAAALKARIKRCRNLVRQMAQMKTKICTLLMAAGVSYDKERFHKASTTMDGFGANLRRAARWCHLRNCAEYLAMPSTDPLTREGAKQVSIVSKFCFLTGLRLRISS